MIIDEIVLSKDNIGKNILKTHTCKCWLVIQSHCFKNVRQQNYHKEGIINFKILK